jgi:LCCL domain
MLRKDHISSQTLTVTRPNTIFCGLDGEQCEPFNNSSFSFLCPSNCASAQVLEPHTIGSQEIIYRTMVVGGPTPANQSLTIYRGDSFICPSAVHAGIVGDRTGGCGILSRRGEQQHFTASHRNGISSIEFPSSFPLSFSLERVSDRCDDLQWTLFAISACATMVISLITTSSRLFFASVFVIVFFQVALASDPPYDPDFSSVLSIAFERFLPSIFVAWVLYKYCIRRTMHDMKAQIEKTILWLGGCWIGALNNYTFDKIPISRLTPHDLRQQPGAITALVVIVGLLVAAGIGQAWAFRIEGRLLRYLGLYLGLGVVIGSLLAVPGLHLRLHHYILALLLIPGTSLQTRPSLLYQGILIGLFINGVARWGYASILQTAGALLEDGQLGSALPQVLHPVIDSGNISFTIANLAKGFDGLSVLVNDVVRYQQSQLTPPLTFDWSRAGGDAPLFFRFAFTGTSTLGGTWTGDFTKPGTWYANGTWDDILPGPSR